MKKLLFVMMCTLLAIGFAGCNTESYSPYPIPYPPKVKTVGFIGGFKHLDSVSLEAVGYVQIDTEKYVYREGYGVINRLTLIVSAIDHIEQTMPSGTSYLCYGIAAGSTRYQKEYRDLLNLLGDTLYGSVYYEDHIYLHTNENEYAILDPITDIRIVSDGDVDATHPAGTDLSDLFYLVYEDYLYKIQHGYQALHGGNALQMPRGDNSCVRCEPLVNLADQEKRYIGACFFLYSNLPYHIMSGQRITVYIHTDRHVISVSTSVAT